jgi:adenylate kinase
MNIALIGPTGAGKGTQCARLVNAFGLRHLATGDLFRQNVNSHTALGLLARRYLDAGELVPDEVVEAMVEEQVRKTEPPQGLLFDGYPRTVGQARFLDELMTAVGQRLDAVIYLELSDEAVLARLEGRRVCGQCHQPYHLINRPPARPNHCDVCGGELEWVAQDRADLATARLRAFRRAIGPVLDYYQQSGRLRSVDASTDVESVKLLVDEALSQPKATEQTPAPHRAELLTTHEPARLPAHAPSAQINLVLLGGPGSGKGTQAEQLSREFHLPHIATGDLFRENLKQNTELGRLARDYMNRGELVPDEITEAMVRERLARPDTEVGFVLDGFPRTLPQAEELTDILASLKRHVSVVLYINVTDEAIVERLSGRWICRQCQTPYHLKFKPPQKPGLCDRCGGILVQREDDNANTVRARLKTFHAQTEPLVNYYRQTGVLQEIDGCGDVSSVTQHSFAVVQALSTNVKNP